MNYDKIAQWFCDTHNALLSYGLTQEELDWLVSHDIYISTQYIGLLRLYLPKESVECLNELGPIVQFGGIMDSLAIAQKENIGREELYYKALTQALRNWIKIKREL